MYYINFRIIPRPPCIIFNPINNQLLGIKIILTYFSLRETEKCFQASKILIIICKFVFNLSDILDYNYTYM